MQKNKIHPDPKKLRQFTEIPSPSDLTTYELINVVGDYLVANNFFDAKIPFKFLMTSSAFSHARGMIEGLNKRLKDFWDIDKDTFSFLCILRDDLTEKNENEKSILDGFQINDLATVKKTAGYYLYGKSQETLININEFIKKQS